MLHADTVNICVRVMGVSSFWHTFLKNFQSTLHLLWPPETLLKLLKLVNFYSLFTAWSPLASTGLYTHVLHINCTFVFPYRIPLLFIPPLSFLPPHLLLHLLLLSSSFYFPSTNSQISFLCSTPPFPFRHVMTPLPFIKLAYTSDTAQTSKWEEKKGKVMWQERKGSLRATPESYLRPSLKHGLLLLPFVSSPPFFFKHCLYLSRKTLEKEGDNAQGRYWGSEVPHRRNKSLQWVVFSKSGQIIWLKQGEEMLLASQASSDSKMPVLCFWYYNFDLQCYITYCLGIILFAALL